jgi:hypothetical protein
MLAPVALYAATCVLIGSQGTHGRQNNPNQARGGAYKFNLKNEPFDYGERMP